eukprot:scaffold3068_cov401-Prasinococcus_capsulatus_cf.AAC.45
MEEASVEGRARLLAAPGGDSPTAFPPARHRGWPVGWKFGGPAGPQAVCSIDIEVHESPWSGHWFNATWRPNADLYLIVRLHPNLSICPTPNLLYPHPCCRSWTCALAGSCTQAELCPGTSLLVLSIPGHSTSGSS